MGNYIDKNIGPTEAVRYTARVSLWNFSIYFLVGGLLVVGLVPLLVATISAPSTGQPSSLGTYVVGFLLLAALLILIWPFIARWSTELAITEKRLIAKYGVLSTHSIEIRFDKIETVRVTQGLIGKVFDYGDIVVTGTGSTFDPIRNIASPMAFRSALNEAMEANELGRAKRPGNDVIAATT